MRIFVTGGAGFIAQLYSICLETKKDFSIVNLTSSHTRAISQS